MLLKEIGDTKRNLQWQKHGNFELSSFTENDEEYQIQIEKKPIFKIPELKGKKVAEVSFFLKNEDDSEKSFSTVKSKNPAFKVYSIVANSLLEKLNEYDAFYFLAERRHSSESEEEYETKKEIYRFFADKVKRVNGRRYYEKEDYTGHIYLVSSIPLSHETQDSSEFKNPLKEAMIACGFDSPFARSI